MSVDAEDITTPRGGINEYVCLKGWPPLDRFIRTMRDASADSDVDVARVVEEWRGAQRVVQELERQAPYPSAPPDFSRSGGDVVGEATQLAREPLFTSSFSVARTTIQVVPLDRLIAFQPFINISYAKTLVDRFSRQTTEHDVFRLCLSLREPLPQVQQLCSEDSCLFVSDSTDLRLLPLNVRLPGKTASPGGSGRELAVVSVGVGFGTNYVNAVLLGPRLVLLNGSHRAYAAMIAGRHEIPCAIQHLDDDTLLPLIAPAEVVENYGVYFESKRPPLLGDFLDKRLVVERRVPAKKRCLRVTIVTEEFDVPDLG